MLLIRLVCANPVQQFALPKLASGSPADFESADSTFEVCNSEHVNGNWLQSISYSSMLSSQAHLQDQCSVPQTAPLLM